MTKFKFVKYKTNKKIRVIFKDPGSDIFVVFLHGLKSDLTGKKPNYLKFLSLLILKDYGLHFLFL